MTDEQEETIVEVSAPIKPSQEGMESASEKAQPEKTSEVKKTKKEKSKKEEPSVQAPASSHSQPKAKRSFLSLVSILFTLSLAAGLAWFGYQGFKHIQTQKDQIVVLQNSLASVQSAQQGDVAGLRQAQSQLDQKLGQNARQSQSQLTALDQRVTAQGKRLRALSDTSRDDWLLAEAEYLLKLANQRVRIERSADGAQALLEEADGILRDLDEPSLYSLRGAIAKDLAALRLMQKIDLEGIYLSLVALTGQVETLPVHPQKDSEVKLPELALEETRELSFGDMLATKWRGFIGSFGEYFRVRKVNAPAPLLAPDDAMYLQQNLRLILERAQLALLREQQEIFSQSVNQADSWIKKYYPESGEKIRFRQALANLSDKTVVQTLPDISRSLNLLHEYIEQLHDLKGAKVPMPKASTKES